MWSDNGWPGTAQSLHPRQQRRAHHTNSGHTNGVLPGTLPRKSGVWDWGEVGVVKERVGREREREREGVATNTCRCAKCTRTASFS